MASLLPCALFTFLWSPQSRAREKTLLQGLWLGEGTGWVGQWLWPPAQAASLAGTAARRGKPVTLTKVFIKGPSCLSPSAIVSGGVLRTFAGFIYFYFINIAKTRYSPSTWRFAPPCSQVFIGLPSLQLLGALCFNWIYTQIYPSCAG